jgi:hypothetical protein
MRFSVIILLLLVLEVLLTFKAFSQDISTILEQKPFDFSGSLNLNQMASFKDFSYSTSNPYSLFINGSASFLFYGINVPFSFSYSNQHINYSHPFDFNQFGMQPSWKWIKTYIGYNSMSFSPYSLNGHQFLGGGIELTPKKIGFRLSAMFGRLIKAVDWEASNPTLLPYYERLGYATKLGYTSRAGDYEISVFKAFDKTTSIQKIPDSLGIAPQENMVYTVKLGRTFSNKIKLNGLFAGSAITNDTRQFSNSNLVNKRGFFLINPNATTSYSYALKSTADYLGQSYTVGIAYERIQPNYKTLGAYFSNNDLENIAITFSKQLIQGKLNVSGSAGKQRNNLDKSKISTSNQFLGSLNISYAPTQRLNISTSYSNYSFYTNMKTPFDQINTLNPYKNLDTLDYTQISNSASINSSIIIGSIDEKNVKNIVMTSFSFQQSVNKQEGIGNLTSSYFYQGSIAYSHSIMPIDLSISTSLLGSYCYVTSLQKLLMAGPVIGLSKFFLGKKLTTNTSIAYNISLKSGEFNGDVYSIRIGSGYSHQKVHRVNFNLAFIYKNNEHGSVKPKSKELTGNLGYTYSFDMK